MNPKSSQDRTVKQNDEVTTSFVADWSSGLRPRIKRFLEVTATS